MSRINIPNIPLRTLALVALALAGCVILYYILPPMADIQEFLTHLKTNHPTLTPLIFGLIYTIAVAASLPLATPLTLLSGLLFGGLGGGLLVIIAASLGATIVFSASRFIFTKQREYLAKSATFTPWLTRLEHNAVPTLLLLRLVPLFPFVVVNILPSLTRVKLRTFVWTTAVGIIPGTLAFAFAGAAGGSIESARDILSPPLLGALVFLVIIMWGGKITAKRLAQKP